METFNNSFTAISQKFLENQNNEVNAETKLSTDNLPKSSWTDNYEQDIADNHLKTNLLDKLEGELHYSDRKLPPNFLEIDLYNPNKDFDENFNNGEDKKYILIEINKDERFTIKNPQSILPTPQCKCVIDIRKAEEHNALEFIPIDYESIFGLRFLSFIDYNSDYFLCDERVFFEALLIKYKSFNFKPYYWSKEKIFNEVGIKKDRATKIIEKFKSIGILSTTVKKSFVNNRPQQITYFNLDSEKIIELAPKIYKPKNSINPESDLREYLSPSLNNYYYSKMQ